MPCSMSVCPPRKLYCATEALAELTRRYFTGHGPASEEDFIWWSGLIRADVRSGIEMAKPQLEHDAINGQTYWFAASMTTAKVNRQASTCCQIMMNISSAILIEARSSTCRMSISWMRAAIPLSTHDGNQRSSRRDMEADSQKGCGYIIELNPRVPSTKSEKQTVSAAAEEVWRVP